VVIVWRVTYMHLRRPVSTAAAVLALLGLIAALLLLAPGTAGTARAQVAQREPAARNITLAVDKKTVVKGRKVKLSGAVVAATDASCAAGVVLDVQRSTSGASYPTVASVTTDAAGAYKIKIKVTKKARFRVAVAASATCLDAQSPPRTVEVSKPAS